jgi:chromosome segregation ATPase
LEEDGLKIFQMSQTIDQKERLYTHIKDQVDDLSRQLESLQKSMLQREEDSANTIASLRKELKSQGKERKAMEQKLKDQRDLASSKQQDSLNQSKIVQDKDAMIKKLRMENDKLKLQKEDLAKAKLMQDQRLGGLE